MFISIARIFLLCNLLLLHFNLVSLEPVNERKIEKCDDCISIWDCEGTKQYANNWSQESLDIVASHFCGITSSINVCCSKFNGKVKTKPPSPKFPDGNEQPTTSTSEQEEVYHPNLKLLPEDCGKILATSENRITMGEKVNLYEFPWIALIIYGQGSVEEYECAGTLINSRYVLTAAHCITDYIKHVRIGEYHIGKEEDCDDSVCESYLQNIPVENKIVHEQYNSLDHHINDIALLRLTKDVDMSHKNAGVICLPTAKEQQNMSLLKEHGTVAGWGLTEHRKSSSLILKATLYIYTYEECSSHYKYIPQYNSTRFCAGDRSQAPVKTDTCKGDSGGPMMRKVKDMVKDIYKYYQYGIISTGQIGCGRDTPGIYTDVRKYINWILDNIKE